MSTHTKVLCDICGNEAQHKQKNIQVVFVTEQTEGRYCAPHLTNETMDICDECISKIVEVHPLRGEGAQGHNTYTLRGRS